jgi:outer membrane protein assembly factor BamB
VVDDPDAIWKPGYEGPPPIVGSPRVDEQPPGRTDRGDAVGESLGRVLDVPARGHRSRGWRFGVGVALGLVLIAAVGVLDPLDFRDESTLDEAADVSADDRLADEIVPVEPSRPVIERPDPSVFGGPAARRLPVDAATLWSVDIQDTGDHWVDVIGRDLVIAAVAEPIATPLDANAPAPPVTTVVALDAPTGEQRWTLQLPAHPRDVTVIGAVDEVLVLEQPGVIGPTVFGVDVVTGETRWSADAAPNDGHVGLIGTPFIARLPSSPDRFVSLIDAASGRDVGTIASDSTAIGRPGGWFTDRRGTWYVIDEGEVVAYDLRSELGEATVIGPVDDVSMLPIVVDDRLVVVDDSGSITFAGADARGAVTVSAGVPAPVRSLTPVSGSHFVVTAPGSIAGVVGEGDTVNVTWSHSEGAVVDEHPVEGGTLLQVATRGGAAMQLVDGANGETVENLTMLPGAMQALVVAGDGLVALRASDFGARLAGIDLDGTERWSIAGSAPVVVGDRIAVRATSNDVVDEHSAPSSRQLRITAYGDVE